MMSNSFKQKEKLLEDFLNPKIHIPLGSTGYKGVFQLDCVLIQSDIVINGSTIHVYVDIFP